MLMTQLSESTASVSLPLCGITCFPGSDTRWKGWVTYGLQHLFWKNRVNEETKLSTQQPMPVPTTDRIRITPQFYWRSQLFRHCSLWSGLRKVTAISSKRIRSIAIVARATIYDDFLLYIQCAVRIGQNVMVILKCSSSDIPDASG